MKYGENKKLTMRSIHLVFIFAVIFVGCKSKSRLTSIGDIRNADSSGGWSKNYRNEFIKDCIDKATESVNAAEAFNYCNCMTEKVEATYPDENDVETKLSTADIAAMKKECLTPGSKENSKKGGGESSLQSWSDADQKQFTDNCIPTANRSLGASRAATYCDCLLKRLMQEYPDSKNVDKASKTHLSTLAAECLGR
jgi:hypothetical protein